jgi:hypothetical protein
MGRTNIATQVEDESELLERFEEFEEATGYGNRSKAVRAALRRGLDEFENEGDGGTYSLVEEWLLNVAAVVAGVALVLAVVSVVPSVPIQAGITVSALLLLSSLAAVLAVDQGLLSRLGAATPDVGGESSEVAE